MGVTIINRAAFDAAAGLTPENRRVFITANDSQANTFEAEIKNAGTVTGNVKGYFTRPDGVTVIIAGTLTNSVAAVTLTENCYYHAGHFTLSIQVGTTTVRIVQGTVISTCADRIIDESGSYSLAELMTLINAKIDAPAAAGTNGQALFSNGAGGTYWGDVNIQNTAGTVIVGTTEYELRTGTAGAAGYLTLVKG